MTLFVIIPVKPFADGKSRLKPILSDAVRYDLNRRMCGHVLSVAKSVLAASRIIVVSADSAALALAESHGAIQVMESQSNGLNAALTLGAKTAIKRGAGSALILPTDLPALTGGDIAALRKELRNPPSAVIAPDRRNEGTNALLLSPPDAFAFRFGANSFALHRQAAHGSAIDPAIIRRDGLAFDIDTPEDYQEFESLTSTGG